MTTDATKPNQMTTPGSLNPASDNPDCVKQNADGLQQEVEYLRAQLEEMTRLKGYAEKAWADQRIVLLAQLEAEKAIVSRIWNEPNGETPVTDAFEKSFGEMPGAMRRLERERNAAITRALTAEKERDAVKQELAEARTTTTLSLEPILKVIAERDALKCQMDELAKGFVESLKESGDELRMTESCCAALRDQCDAQVDGQAGVIDRLRMDVAALRADEGRLDWLDLVNIKSNERNGTVYGWRFEQNHLRASLTDHHAPHKSVREAIDDAIDAALAQKPI